MITAADIESLFGDLISQIESAQLRKQVVATWVRGAAAWDSVEELRKMPFTLLTDTHGIDFIAHVRAVTVGAMGLGRAQQEQYDRLPYQINFDYLVAGGLLHDVGKLLEFEPDGDGGFRKSHRGRCARHPISGAILAAQERVPEEIVNIIACHAKEGDGRPQRVETVLVHQADFAVFNPLVMMNKGTLIEKDGA